MKKLFQYSQLQFVGLTDFQRIFLVRKLNCLLQKSLFSNLIVSEHNSIIFIASKDKRPIPFGTTASLTLEIEAQCKKSGKKLLFKPYKMASNQAGIDPYIVFEV